MEILYTEITKDLTESLLTLAKKELKKGLKVYYIVPSSMSFEKEKEILERLADGKDTAVFDLLVTRFKQLPYYFDKQDKTSDKVELGTVGISMLFRKILKSFSKNEIPLYFSQQNSTGFLELLVNLRSELISAHLSSDDLPDNPKNRELKLILSRFEEEITKFYANYSEFGAFTESVLSEKFKTELNKSVLIIDGYTRFTAEEELFISAVHNKVSRFIIGTYADKKSLLVNQLQNGIYENSSEMIRRFQSQFSAKIQELDDKIGVNEVYMKLTNIVEKDNSFVLSDKVEKLSGKDENHFQIWKSENQKVEINRVATEIRQKIVEGYKFKDFTVLVSDIESYKIPLKESFELFEIPFFYAEEEKMNQHPLIIFFESLYAIKRNNYKSDDVINLLKSKIYSNSEQNLLDYFEYYVNQFKIYGRKRFAESFKETEFTHYHEIEKLRSELFGEKAHLQKFLSQTTQKTGKKWVLDLQDFLEKGNVVNNMNHLLEEAEESNHHELADKHEQVWKLILSTLTEFLAVFSEQKLKLINFLEIIVSGLKNANYRQIPSNVDVVNVKDYELVEPRTNKFVYAIGLSQANFPRIKKNSTLLSDKEREEINQNTENNQFIEQLNVVNYNKNVFTTLSLINSAREKLVLSTPQILVNMQEEISSTIQLFVNHSDDSIIKEISDVNSLGSLEYIGNVRSVISSIGIVERELLNTEKMELKSKEVFWSSIFRILTKSNEAFGTMLLNLDKDISTVNLSSETVNQLYDGKIFASVSSFERFYNCEYQYFLENTLGIEIFENIDINSKVVGNFFHEIFEKVMIDEALSLENFDEKLSKVISEVNSEYSSYFMQDARARFTGASLEEIAKQTAVVLKKTKQFEQLKTIFTESSFGLPKSELGDFIVDDIQLRGRIDRIDQLSSDSLGAIDYKSSAHSFKIQDAYDGISLQFLTYLNVLKNNFSDKNIWGALYLQFKNGVINLNDVNQISDIGNLIDKNMKSEGLLLSEQLDKVKEIDSISINKNNVYSDNEFEALLKLNESHYQRAGQHLREGKIAINPVMKRSEGIDKSGNVKGCKYCPLKSICRFEANVHMNHHTREIGIKNRKEILEELRGEE